MAEEAQYSQFSQLSHEQLNALLLVAQQQQQTEFLSTEFEEEAEDAEKQTPFEKEIFLEEKMSDTPPSMSVLDNDRFQGKTEEDTKIADKLGDTSELGDTNEIGGENEESIENIGSEEEAVNSQRRPKVNKVESLKEFLVMKNDDDEKITLENEGLDDVINKDESSLSDEERMLLYDKAMSFKSLGSINHALLCFLGCLKGLQPSSQSKFTMLPQCLTHISEIYATAGDYQKAVEFMQGTKLYYETAIIEAGIQVDQYKKETGTAYHPLDLDPCLDEARRANEYERLSHSCLEQQKFQLALEYCGKATKLRQKVYGDEHHLTVKSLDLFTLIYAEMGKSQYSEAMGKYGDIAKAFKKENMKENLEPESDINNQDIATLEQVPADEKPQMDGVDERPGNGIEERSGEENEHDENEEERTNQDEDYTNQPESEVNETAKESVSFARNKTSSSTQITACQFFFFFVLSSILAVLLTIIWCHVTESQACPTQKYMYTQVRYWYYFYFKTATTNSSFY